MATTTMTPRAGFARRPLAGLGKLTLAALAGIALLLIGFMTLVIGEFVPPLAIIAAIPLIVAGVVATGWRWAPLLGTLVFGLLSALLVMGAGEIVYTLTHPGGVLFTLLLIVIPLLAVGLGVSVGATVQNYQSAERRTPRWLPGALLLIAGLIAGASAVGAMAQAGDAAGVSPETLAGLPAVTLDTFEGGQIRVKAGETVALRLENPDPVAHAFAIDELGVEAPMPAGTHSLALFKPTKPGNYTFYCTPHYDKASGQGMHGTLIVE